jgi:hypothetical protein
MTPVTEPKIVSGKCGKCGKSAALLQREAKRPAEWRSACGNCGNCASPPLVHTVRMWLITSMYLPEKEFAVLVAAGHPMDFCDGAAP